MSDFTRATAQRLAATTYDLVIVGGGVNGAAIARDAALRGLSVCLVDKGDFCGETSAWNSRLIHGGLRYLEHGEIPLVYESLHDRERLLRIAPHLVKPLPFVVPLYRHNHLPGVMFRIGMVMYDALSITKSVPRHRTINRKRVSTELPGLNPSGLSGALHYYDGQVTYPERLIVETLISAARHGAVVANHMRAVRVVAPSGVATGLEVRDELTGEEVEVEGRCVVNAAGPWADDLIAPLGSPRQIGGTTGTHLVVDRFPGAPDAAIYYEAYSDNRAILVIPWNGRYLIGTTDDRYDGDPGAVRGTSEEVAYLLSETNRLIPEAGLSPDSVLYTYTGVRPLPYRPDAKPGDVPRAHLIETHPAVPNLITIVGGKLTPHLSLGREVVDKAVELLGAQPSSSIAASRQLPGAIAASWKSLPVARRSLINSLPWEPELSERIVDVYGSAARAILARWRSDESLRRIVGSGRGAVVAAEVAHVIEAEAARTLVDIVHRRTMVGLEPALGADVDVEVAQIAAERLGWDEAQTRSEVARHREHLGRLLGGVPQSSRATSSRSPQIV